MSTLFSCYSSKLILKVVFGFFLMSFFSCDSVPTNSKKSRETGHEEDKNIKSSVEFFYSGYPHAFISSETHEPVLINGVNIKRGPHKHPNGNWETPFINQEITALGRSNAPNFNVIRINMDWPYFQNFDGSPVESSYEQLDILIDNAIEQGLYVILNPIHVRRTGRACDEDEVMFGARWNIPAWAWDEVDAPANPSGSCEGTQETSALMPDVMALNQTNEYFQYIVTRYDASTARGRQVIAVNLVSEPHATGNTGPDHFNELLPIYETWLADDGKQSVRAANPDKILILGPARGDVSLVGLDLSGLMIPNFVFSLHDYFGRATGSSFYGMGYSNSGFATFQERTYQSGPTPYNPALLSFSERKEEHKQYLQQYMDWLHKFQLPLFVGEYGILNPCSGGHEEWSPRYAKDTYEIYDNLYVMNGAEAEPIRLARTWWTHGYWDDTALWFRSGSCQGIGPNQYFPYAKELTGELNLLHNPGFEGGLDGWNTSDFFSIVNIGSDSENAHSGAKSVMANHTESFFAELEGVSNNTPNGTYSLTTWSRAAGKINDLTLRIYIDGMLSNEKKLLLVEDWTVFNISDIEVHWGATVTVKVVVDAQGGAAAFFDDFELRKKADHLPTAATSY